MAIPQKERGGTTPWHWIYRRTHNLESGNKPGTSDGIQPAHTPSRTARWVHAYTELLIYVLIQIFYIYIDWFDWLHWSRLNGFWEQGGPIGQTGGGRGCVEETYSAWVRAAEETSSGRGIDWANWLHIRCGALQRTETAHIGRAGHHTHRQSGAYSEWGDWFTWWKTSSGVGQSNGWKQHTSSGVGRSNGRTDRYWPKREGRICKFPIVLSSVIDWLNLLDLIAGWNN